MTYTPPPPAMPPPPPMTQPAGKDNTQLFGIIGIITAICCGLIGLIFGILSIMQARKWGSSPVLGWIAVVIAVLNLFGGIIWQVNR